MERPSWKEQINTRCRSLNWLLAAMLLILAAETHAATFTSTLDRNTITLGERATLSLKFDDGAPADAPSLPGIANLQITYVGPSSQFSFINGRTTSSVTHNYTVTPRQPGEFTIPSLSASVGGQRLASQPLKLRVLQPGAPSPEAVNSGSQMAFLKLVLPKTEIFVGETIVAELQLYLRDVIQGAGDFRITSFPANGITMENSIRQGQERRVQVGNAIYRMVPLPVVLSAVKEGTTEVGPVAASVIIQVPTGNRRRDPFFEQFGIRSPFDDAASEQRQVVLATEAQAVQLLPLPRENVPPNFNGAVGHYEMTVTAGPTNIAVGDPITVRVTISGDGALDSLTLPEQKAWSEFKTYPTITKPVEGADQLGLGGTKKYEITIVPQNTDIRELPPMTFSFFDPEAKAYRTLTQPATPLIVRPGGNTQMPATFAGNNSRQEDSPPVQQDIVPIKQRLGTVAQISPPLAMQPWFLGIQSVPLLAWLAVVAWRKRSDSLASNPRLRRQRLVAQIIHDGLDDLRRFARENKSDEFFASLFRLLQEQLGERLDCPASAITEAVVDEQLRPRGVDQTTLSALHELFQTCNLARYSSAKSREELAAIMPKLESVLNQLKAVKS